MSPAPEQTSRTVTVFGGTGFVGRRIVAHLLARGLRVRVASRHPDKGVMAPAGTRMLETVEADITNRSSMAEAVAGSNAVVNAVSLYVEQGEMTFERVHLEAAADLAEASREAGCRTFVLISGIGSDARSELAYIRSRGRGEDAVRSAFPEAMVVRSAVMIGPDDAFLSALMKMVRLPVCPLFGSGETKLQPVYVEDVAEGVARLIGDERAKIGSILEFAGPRVYPYRDLLREVASALGRRITLVPVPFPAWDAMAFVGERLPGAPLARNQVDLMRIDNVAAPDLPGLADLGVEPRDVDEVIRVIQAQS